MTYKYLPKLNIFNALVIIVMSLPLSAQAAKLNHPTLVVNQQDVDTMREAIEQPGLFQQTFIAKKASVDTFIGQATDVPTPTDAGGGYTHERHKKNYQHMYDAGMMYQLTQDPKYADFVRDMLLQYATLYPTLPRHPKRKSSNEGKLFWQGLNEAVWLVYTIQAYDFIVETLSPAQIDSIESNLLLPVAHFLSVESPHTFNKVHNHGTWATAAVGMTGFVLNRPHLVDIALYDLEKSGKGGFLRQLDELFSPDGYYNEGPYYQRYALLPFVTFAKALQQNQPERKIFEYRDGILLKAIYSTIELSYNGLFFPLNDAIKSKGIDTMELVIAVSMAYGLTADSNLVDIAKQQDTILLTGDGLKLAQAIATNTATHYPFSSRLFTDGKHADEGALVVMRHSTPSQPSVVFKATAQGLGHGHFDKLTWQFYDGGNEIISDYGAARFLNIEAKAGGRYLPENKTWAKQTIAHNTLVADETSHFDADVKVGNSNHPSINYYFSDTKVTLASANIATAYEGIEITRTMALATIDLPQGPVPLVFDIVDVKSNDEHQYDLPVHYQGQLIDTNFKRIAATTELKPLGTQAGYQHLWLRAKSATNANTAQPPINQVTWLNDNGRFYTHSSITDGNVEMLFTQLGANDPNFNLRTENSFIQRVAQAKNQRFVSVIEPHGEYNPSAEYTLNATSNVRSLSFQKQDDVNVIGFSLATHSGEIKQYVLAISDKAQSNHTKNNLKTSNLNSFYYNDKPYRFADRYQLLDITQRESK
ncbi:heparinase II/III family protein [Shewanella sp. 10N.286.45.A1]|uniref:heparinase II/III domain-containing protein n=1 Tax=Shewanella sp. 10N.286.45.A1 TaxID=3229694 RepID=UPI00354CD699